MGTSKSLRVLSILLSFGILFGFSAPGNGQDWWDGEAENPGPAAPPPRTLMATEWTTDTGGELDQYMGNQYGSGCSGGAAPDNSIDFTISINQAISGYSSVLLTLSTWDVDYEGTGSLGNPEIDKVYLNGHYLGNLTGANNA